MVLTRVNRAEQETLGQRFVILSGCLLVMVLSLGLMEDHAKLNNRNKLWKNSFVLGLV